MKEEACNYSKSLVDIFKIFYRAALSEDRNRSVPTNSQKGYVYYYVYRNPFDHFKSMYLTGQRAGNLEEKHNDEFFKYVVEHFLIFFKYKPG